MALRAAKDRVEAENASSLGLDRTTSTLGNERNALTFLSLAASFPSTKASLQSSDNVLAGHAMLRISENRCSRCGKVFSDDFREALCANCATALAPVSGSAAVELDEDNEPPDSDCDETRNQVSIADG